MATNSFSPYHNDRSVSSEPEFAADPASGGFFQSDYKKHDDLKQMLDSNKDGLKLEAMKRIIGMIAKGRDASDLFPAVVKNVVSKNLEVKKLVYVYLVRYAEEQQDLALLSIATFQRALKDPNQLIRASALRVLSSIRVSMIVPIVMLAIKESAADMSPYVRKTAAHAIPKLYSLDPEQKDDLLQVIEKLLSDKTTLVVGSAVMAFEEVCPDRIDLIHKNFRKLCTLLMDVDEWGQVVILNMLVRYARTQFVDPNAGDDGTPEDPNKPFYEDSESEDDTKKHEKKRTAALDPDHRMLLKQAKPLLQSRNAAVVLGVAQLYHHLAPKSDVSMITKALIRLLRGHREVQSVVLNCIASMSTLRKGMFEPYLQSFYVRTSDPTHIKLLKLEIITNLAMESNIGVILRELQTYISSHDKVFVAAAIQAIGRCAANIKEVAETCLNGLVSLLSNRDEAVVAESVVVIKKLLQTQPSQHREIITQMARLVDHITVPQARASILWLLGEYSDRVPKIAPDVLRKMAKTFINEEDLVKMQIVNLAVKLHLTNPEQTMLLCQYVLNLAKYDQNYDLRDRARFLRHFIFPADPANSRLIKQAKKVFLAAKPPPILESKFKDREQYQLGSLSQYLNTRASGYHELPQFPENAPSSELRNVEVVLPYKGPSRLRTKTKPPPTEKSFYSDSERSSPADESSEDSKSSESSSEDDDGDDDDDEESEDDSGEESSQSSADSTAVRNHKSRLPAASSEAESSDKNETSESEKNSPPDSDSDDPSCNKVANANGKLKRTPGSAVTSQPVQPKPPVRSNLDLLLDLDDDGMAGVMPVMTPSLGGFLTPMGSAIGSVPGGSGVSLISPLYIPRKSSELVNKSRGGGLSIDSRFTRAPHLFSSKMISIELNFTNHGPDEVTDIKISHTELSGGRQLHEFAPITALAVGASHSSVMGVDMNDSTQPLHVTISIASGRSIKASIVCPVGEMVRAVSMSSAMFDAERGKLKGMNEHTASVNVSLGTDCKSVRQKIYEAANVGPVQNADDANVVKFVGETLSSKSLVLVTVCLSLTTADIIVNCEKMVIGSMLLNQLKTSFTQ